MKRIVFSANSSFSLYNFRFKLMEALKEKGYNIITIAPEDKYSHFLKEEFEYYPIKNLNRRGTNPFEDFRLLIEYLKLFHKIKPNLIISFTIKPNIYGSIAGGILGIPVIGVVTGLGYVFIRKNLLTKVVKLLYKIAFSFNKYVIFLNEDDMNTLINLVGNKARLIESEGVDISYFNPNFCNRVEKYSRDEFVFLFVGRLLKDKGIYELVEAGKRLKKLCPKVRILLVGDIDEGNPASIKKEEIERWINEGSVEWIGFQKDIRPFLCKAQCFVLPSYREGLSRSLLEAMAMEKPIITTDVPGCRNVCKNGENGFFIKPKDIDSLFYAMKKMVELTPKDRKKMGNRGRKIVIEKYEISKIVNKYIELIEKILFDIERGS